MITSLFLKGLLGIVSAFASMLPDSWTPPDWLVGVADAIAGFVDSATTMNVWIPLDFAMLCAASLISAYMGGAVVKGLRILVSHFTGGGGGAA